MSSFVFFRNVTRSDENFGVLYILSYSKIREVARCDEILREVLLKFVSKGDPIPGEDEKPGDENHERQKPIEQLSI